MVCFNCAYDVLIEDSLLNGMLCVRLFKFLFCLMKLLGRKEGTICVLPYRLTEEKLAGRIE